MKCGTRLLWIIIFESLLVVAVKTQPRWVKEAVEASKSGSYPSESSAVILVHTEEVKMSADNNTRTHVRDAVLLLNSSGKQLAAMSEPISPERKIEHLDGWRIERNGTSHDLSKENISEIALREHAAMYDNDREIVAHFPDVESNNVVAYEYEIVENDWTSTFQKFRFQRQQPVEFAQVSVTIPDNWELHYAGWNIDSIIFEHHGTSYQWTAHHLPYQPEEPLMPSWEYVSREIAISAYRNDDTRSIQFKDWQAVAAWCADLHRTVSVPDETTKQFTRHLVGDSSGSWKKLQKIGSFVRDEIRYVGIEIGKERWQPHDAGSVFYNKYGDCKDKTTLMRAMLKAVDIPSIPVLVNADQSIQTKLPTPFQFNHCIVGIPLSSLPDSEQRSVNGVNGWLLFDPTDEANQLGELPGVLRGSSILLCGTTDSTLCRIPRRGAESNYRRYRIDAHLFADGSVTARIEVKDFKNWAAESRHLQKISTPAQNIESWRKHLENIFPAVKLSDYKSEATGDSAWETFQIAVPGYLIATGSLTLLKPDMMHSSEVSQLRKNQRVHPIWFGGPRMIETDITWQLPTGWRIQTPLPSGKNTFDVGSFSYLLSLAGPTAHFHKVEEYDGVMLASSQYEQARQFEKELNAMKALNVLLIK